VRLIRAIALRLFSPSPDLRGFSGKYVDGPGSLLGATAPAPTPKIGAARGGSGGKRVIALAKMPEHDRAPPKEFIAGGSRQGAPVTATAVYLTSCVDVVPVLLLHNLNHNKSGAPSIVRRTPAVAHDIPICPGATRKPAKAHTRAHRASSRFVRSASAAGGAVVQAVPEIERVFSLSGSRMRP
jgi:hypothetical protein